MTTDITYWVTASLILITLEFVVPGAILGFLGLSGLIVAALLHFGWISGFFESILSWFMISIFSIIFLRNFALKVMPGDTKVHNTDEDKDALGSIVVITEEIRPEKKGRIAFRDSTWTAQCSDKTIKKGDKATIIGRKGSTWLVKSIL